MSGKRVKPFLYVVFSLFKVTSSSAERERQRQTDRERQTDRDREIQRQIERDGVWCIIISRTSHIHIVNFSFILFVLLICSAFYFVLICDNIRSVEKENVCNIKGTVMQTEKLRVNNR